MKTITIICEWCGASSEKSLHGGRIPRFCNKACSAQWRMSRPEYVASIVAKQDRSAKAEVMKRNWQNPEFVARLHSYLGSERNPFLDRELRAKGEAVLREQGYRMLNGGNGTGLTVPQRMLAERLGWQTEFIVPTKMPRRSGYPTHYKLDIAEPSLLTAVEVDGQSHLAKDRIAKDAKKDEFLEHLGWRIVRVRNEAVLEDCEIVASSILCSISKPPLRTTSLTESWSTIAIG